MSKEDTDNIASGEAGNIETALFAGGCFWCMEPVFEKIEGVLFTKVGYTGGHLSDPSYEEVVKGGTGHVEAIQIGFDPAVVTFDKLLDAFWKNIDPFDEGGQFFDRGESYSTAVYYGNESQKSVVELSKERLEKGFGKKIATKIKKAAKFYPGEDYHQKYHLKNPLRYELYQSGSGRKQKLKEIWNKKG